MFTKKKIFIYLLILIIVVLTHQAWFLSFSTIIGSDWGFYYAETMQEWFPIHSIWNPHLNFGYYDFVSVPFLLPYFLRGLLSIAHVDFVIIDRLLYLYPVALIAPLSMFFLCYKLTKNLFASLIGSMIYSINTYFLTIQIGHFTLALVYALFPIVFIIFVNFLRAPNYKGLLMLIVLLFVCFSNEARITFLALLILLLYFIFSIFFEKKEYTRDKSLLIIRYIIIGIVLFIGLLSFFITPLLFVRDIGIDEVSGRGFFGADYFPIQNAFTLFHPFWDGTVTTEFIPQPIPVFFWMIPIIAFGALFFLHKDKKILFFAILALIGIFLSKGITDPFGQIYSFLYFHVPGFSFFREPSKFYFIIAFSYAVLFSFFITYFLQILYNKLRNSLLRHICIILFIIPFISFFVLVSKPVVQGTLGYAFRQTFVPEEYYALKDFLLEQNNFFRTMYVPNRQRFEVLTANHPSLSYFGIPNTLKTLDPEILKLFSVKYVILPLDSTNDVYRHYASREVWERKIQQQDTLKKIDNKKLGNINIYENTRGFLPHIYISDSRIYVDGDPSLLNQMSSLLPDKKNSLYFTKSLKNFNKNIDLSQDKNQFDSYYVAAQCIRCVEEKPWENFQFPFAKFLPDSPLYFLVQYKEQKRLESLKIDPQLYHQEIAFYSLKRIVELQGSIEKGLPIEYTKHIIGENDLLVGKLNAYYDTLTNDHLENNEQLLKLLDYVSIEKKIIGDFLYKEDLPHALKEILQQEYYKLDKSDYKINGKLWKSNNTIKRYIVNLPENTSSEILVKNNQNIQPIRMIIDDEELTSIALSGEWLSFGHKNFNKGIHGISVQFDEKKNLISTNAATFSANSKDGIKKIKIPISNFNEENEYSISFAYQSEQGKPTRYFLSQDADRINNESREVELDQFLKTDNVWHTFGTKIKPKIGSTNGSLEFWIEADGEQDTIFHIKNLKVESVNNPLIMLKRENKTVSPPSPVVLPIKTISPTHYQAIVSNVKTPFLLVFNEQYHNGWVASINTQKISERDHKEVNGFANGWFIDKKGSYTIDLYFTPQKYYIFGVFISLVVLMLILLTAIYSKKRKDEK